MEIMEYLKICLIVCPLIFLGSFVDSVAGGGGIITLPAYMLAGLPVHTASGTNKLVAVCGSVTASYRYLKSGNVMIKIAVWSAIGSLLGGALGARLALFIPEEFIEKNLRGVKVSKPKATYMLFIDCEDWCKEHGKTMDELEKVGLEVGVLWQDGREFHGKYSIRLNLALPHARVQEAFERLDKYVFNA